MSGGVIAALIGGNKFIYKHFDRDEEFISSLISLESEFWKRVEDKNPPPMDGSDDSSEVLNILYPKAVPESSISLPYDTADTIQRLIQLKQSIKELEDEKAEKENRLKELLGENETGYVEKWRVDWKSYTSTRLDTKALKNSQPNIYQEFSRETESRRFSIREV
ncbi:YqaJ viral recombinase family protein [Mesotoga sp.]|uniref:YqaJ viral recombinase family nuclease n=1 Tax=Mesotoga sp. TaxID=2053577 RepID=UPI00345E872F